MIEKIKYRGWNDCYRISNDIVEIIVNASSGGRVMHYSIIGQNIIYEDVQQNGKLLKDYNREGFDPDGGRFDYGPERKTEKLHNISYYGPYKAEIVDDLRLKLISLPDRNLGLQTTRTFHLDRNSEKLSIIQEMLNISDDLVEYFFWGRTLVKAGGIIFAPVNKQSKNPDLWGRYIWGDPDQFASDPEDKSVVIQNGLFTLSTANPKNKKFGIDSKEGWMAYVYKDLLFIKSVDYFEGSLYAEEFGQTNIFYVDKSKFAEMEPISPLVRLRPEENYSFTEEWYLLNYLSLGKKDFNLSSARELVFNRIGK